MWAILGALGAAVLTGLVGNALVQHWQQRNWYAQQRQIGYQDELRDLSKLLEELTTGANSRLFQMKRLRHALRASLDELHDEIEEYSNEVKSWNILLPAFYNRIIIHFSFIMAKALEDDVQCLFVNTGAAIEKAIRLRRSGAIIPSLDFNAIDRGLAQLTANLRNFLLEMTRRVSARRTVIRDGRIIRYTEGQFSEYRTFELFKFLFSRDVESVYVVRPA